MLLTVALGAVAAAVGIFQYQRIRSGWYDQLETSTEAVLEALENVLAGAPELFEPARLEPVVQRFGRAVPSVDRVSVIDRSYRIVADSDPDRVGALSGASALIRVIRQDRPDRFYYRRRGRKYYRSSRPLHGVADPATGSAVIGALAIDMKVSPIDARIRRDFLEIFFYLAGIIGVCGAGMYAYLRRSFVAPLLDLSSAAARVGGGDYSARVAVRTRDELGELSASFNRMARDLGAGRQALEEAHQQLIRQERLAALGELAGSVAHEIRNPLGAMKNSVFFLRLTQKFADEKALEHLDLIDRQVDRANGIITELLDYARQPAVRIERRALQEIVEGALAELPVPDSVSVDRHLETDPVIVEADPAQIERILTNLLSNAAEAMPEGGNLRVECRRHDAEALVSVADTGVGIAGDDLRKIFEPLVTSKAKGIGLGLAVSQRYAQLHGGRIECESELGRGTTFRLILPAVPGAEPDA